MSIAHSQCTMSCATNKSTFVHCSVNTPGNQCADGSPSPECPWKNFCEYIAFIYYNIIIRKGLLENKIPQTTLLSPSVVFNSENK